MLKKVITIVFLLCMIFSISAMAVNAVNETQQEGEWGGMPPMDEMPSGEFTPPEGFVPPENGGEFTPPQSSGNNAEAVNPPANENVTDDNRKTPENSENSGQMQSGNSPFGSQMPEGMNEFFGNMQSSQNTAAEQPAGLLGFIKTYSTPITSVVLLGLAFIFVIFYRRKNY